MAERACSLTAGQLINVFNALFCLAFQVYDERDLGRQRPVLHGRRLPGAPPAGGDSAEQRPGLGEGEHRPGAGGSWSPLSDWSTLGTPVMGRAAGAGLVWQLRRGSLTSFRAGLGGLNRESHIAGKRCRVDFGRL